MRGDGKVAFAAIMCGRCCWVVPRKSLQTHRLSVTDSVLGQDGGVISFRIRRGNRRWALVLGGVEDRGLLGGDCSIRVEAYIIEIGEGESSQL